MDEQSAIRQEKLKKLQEAGIDPYPYSFARTRPLRELIAAYGAQNAADLEKVSEEFTIAGRLIAIRDMGKSAFAHLFDGEEKMQIYIRRDRVSEKTYALYKLLDIGDIVGAVGRIFKTHSGELTLLLSELTLLVKSLHPLPEKWHGLQDVELRFRQRYLDLIMNEKTRRIFRLRSRFVQKVRAFFHEKGYVEVETPMMHPIPGGAAARPFVTHHNALNNDFYLRIAPELYLKKLLVGGMEKVFELNRNFRNEGIDMMHNPEFTMLEFYELYRDYEDYIRLTEELFAFLNAEFAPNGEITFRDQKISVKPPFPRVRFMDALAAASGWPEEALWDEKALAPLIRDHLSDDGLPPTYGKMLELAFDRYVEDRIVNPTFITDYPLALSPLSKQSRRDDRETERFELIIAGMEVANGFSELNDPAEQRRRFEAQARNREKGDEEALLVDHGFLKALEHGMAPAAGEGIGIDRLIMLYADAPSIKEVILFPLLKPKNEV